MENKSTNTIEFCANGCGFYGNPIYNNMCSKCFKETQKCSQPEAQPTVIPSVNKEAPAISVPTTLITDALKELEASAQAEVAPVQQIIDEDAPAPKKTANKSRCKSCRAKIPLAKQAINKCLCDYVFCDSHKYPTDHSCEVDFAKRDLQILSKNNPKFITKPKGGRSFTRIEDY